MNKNGTSDSTFIYPWGPTNEASFYDIFKPNPTPLNK